MRGLDAYRAGQHYEAHELWEEIWQDEPDPQRSALLQALIQIASAVHKARNDVAPRGSLRLVERALERLADLPETFMGVDLVRLRDGAARLSADVARELEASGHSRLSADAAPEIALIGEPPDWDVAVASVVPAVARSAWFQKGLGAYRGGAYFEAHELWEELWRDEPDPDHKQFLQGLIQVAAAMHKVQEQHKPDPAARLLQRALLRLSVFPADYFGLRVDRLLEEARRAERVLRSAAGSTSGHATLTDELVPTIATR